MSNVVFSNIKKLGVLLCAIFIISACATHVVNVQQVALDDNINYLLQPIPENLMNTGIQTLFKVRQQDEIHQFIMQVEMTQSSLFVSAITPEGLSLFNLDWNLKLNTLNYDNKIAIDPLRVLAELQFVLWPLSEVAKGLEQAKVKSITDNHREISSMNGVVYQIKQQGNVSYLNNLKKNYLIEIEELERWQLSSVKVLPKQEQFVQNIVITP